jgi:beta-lactamase regulating signal transducer with metallopeptidase domain
VAGAVLVAAGVVVEELVRSVVVASATALSAVVLLRFHHRASAAFRHVLWLFVLLSAVGSPIARIAERVPASRPIVHSVAPAPVVAGPARVVSAVPGSGSALSIPPIAGAAIALVWLLVAGAQVARLLRSSAIVRAMLVRPAPLPEALRRSFDRYVALHAKRRGLRLIVSDRIAGPMAVGLGRPTVVLPAAMLEFAAEDVRCAIAHECAHLDRFDDWTNLVARAAIALAWFNPAAWYALRKVQREREIACDDRVIDGDVNPVAYGRTLTRISDLSRTSSPLVFEFGASGSGLVERVEALVTGRRRHLRNPRPLPLAAACAGIAMAALAFASLVPAVAIGAGDSIAVLDLAIGPAAETTLEIRTAHGSVTLLPSETFRLTARAAPVHTPVHIEGDSQLVCVLPLGRRCASWTPESAQSTSPIDVVVYVPAGKRVTVRTVDARIDDRAGALGPG